MNAKKVVVLGATLLIGVSLTACSDSNKSARSSDSHSTSSKISPLSKAKTDVDSLFDDTDHTRLLEGTTLASIKSVSKEVSRLPKSNAKTHLLADIKFANSLWPEFNAATNSKNSSSIVKDDRKLANQESKDSASEAKASSESIKKANFENAVASSKAESKKKLQQFTKSNSVSLVKEMHERMDDPDGISDKVNRLSKSPSKNMQAIHKEMIVLKNVAKECDNNYMDVDNYPSGDSGYADKVNDFWNLSAKILRTQRDYLGYLINENDNQPSSTELNDNIDQWNSLYHEIVK
ncbi:toxin Cry1Ac domain D-VI-related protein [Lactiplantibacillus plantarum]|uniref:toxin Cry1Ac domain D-VI-related protein n=1 Tax=Lactiplantibacillus TaxID=2767842 RepID=UPI000975BA95|nr:toxin Cry1Ac domain D-VI-related protein [Lactiplantibacillus plantarum]